MLCFVWGTCALQAGARSAFVWSIDVLYGGAQMCFIPWEHNLVSFRSMTLYDLEAYVSLFWGHNVCPKVSLSKYVNMGSNF